MCKLSVVIPALNEEDSIVHVSERVLATREMLAAIGVDQLELIVVDDGSTDRTPELVREMAGVRLIEHEKNRGYGAALKSGFFAAEGDLIGFLDADGTYPPESFPELCQCALAGNDLVIGNRMSGKKSGMPAVRKLGNRLFAVLVSVISRSRIRDSASGMRVFKREILEQLLPLPDGLNLTPVMSTRALHQGIRIVETPINYDERHGTSKLSVARDGTVFLQSIVWTALTYNPVRLLGLAGMSLLAIAAAIAGVFIWLRLSGVTEMSPVLIWAAFTAFLTVVAGLTLFALGVVFNYLVSIFHDRPIRQGLFGKPLFDRPAERHFGWMGLVGLVAGTIASIIVLALGAGSWPTGRLWLYLMASALLTIAGLQLFIYWIIIKVLGELSAVRLGEAEGKAL